MGERSLAPLSPELYDYLQQPRPVLVTSLDAESGWPTNNLITWVLATAPDRIRLAADAKGRVMRNLRADRRLLLTVLALGSALAIEGEAEVITDELAGVSLKLACAEVQVGAVREILFWGGKLVAEPAFDVTYDPALKEKLDTGVFAAMRSL